MQRPWLIACAALACAGGSYEARADVTYNFVTTSYSGLVGENNGIPYDGSGFTGLPLSLTSPRPVWPAAKSPGSRKRFPPPDVFGLAGLVSMTIDTPGLFR